MPTAQQALNVFNRIANRNVEMCAKIRAADQIQIVCQLIMLRSANVYQDMEARLPIQLSVADHYQCHAHFQQIARPIHIATVEFANQLVFWIKSVA